MKLSVICCVYNPDLELLSRVIESVASQSSVSRVSELILVDNCSEPPLEEVFDWQSWPFIRLASEKNPGLTHARLRGLKEAKSEIVLFIDDDNILDKSYVSRVISLFEADPKLGTLGAAKIIPEWVVSPSEDVLPFTNMLALRDSDRSNISCELLPFHEQPYGAGLALRKELGQAYCKHVENSEVSRSLDRVGTALLSGGDIEISLVANKMGYKTGVDPMLELVHVIPESRIQKRYLVGLARGHLISNLLLCKIWDIDIDWCFRVKLIWRMVKRHKTFFSVQIAICQIRAVIQAFMQISKMKSLG